MAVGAFNIQPHHNATRLSQRAALEAAFAAVARAGAAFFPT
jgi:hypothetical protein